MSNNLVIGGDFKGSKISHAQLTEKYSGICIDTPSNGSKFLNKHTIINYSIVNQETQSKGKGALVGGLIAGATGAIIGSAMSSGTTYTIAVEYEYETIYDECKVRKKSLIEIDSNLFKIFNTSMF